MHPLASLLVLLSTRRSLGHSISQIHYGDQTLVQLIILRVLLPPARPVIFTFYWLFYISISVIHPLLVSKYIVVHLLNNLGHRRFGYVAVA